ncbi:autotransporter outer membrane beta-barrel domain-containing protein [Enterobacter asburiae]|uniref:autotransporter outer membrane beta-barrel domain-containing protein n=2 Tax=Enterobacter asburiae TaxID=61645 RepID=UPI001B390DD1|nr:autotransporter outer membrane beta-barrel domain-containing protein [Enterobacter asburiae]MBQ0318465.1 autotransporter outer membrane beta-barrel domain-containing protein [Enterobacter asburiae]
MSVLYSCGNTAVAQVISADTDITKQVVTDGITFATDDVTLNINGASKVTGGGTGPAIFVDSPTGKETINISGQGTEIMSMGAGIQIAQTDGSSLSVTDGARVTSANGNAIYIHTDSGRVATNTNLKVDNATVVGGYAGVHIWADDTTASITNSVLGSTGAADGYALKMTGQHNNVNVENTELNSNALGGIYVRTYNNSTFTISDSTVTDTSSYGYGVRVNNASSTDITINNTKISGALAGLLVDNSASTGSTITLNGSSLKATAGDGVKLGNGFTLNVNEGSTITGNNGIVLYGDAIGSTVNIADSTVTGATNLLQIDGTSAVNTVDFTGSTLSGAITTSSGADQSVSIDSSAWTGSAGKTGTGALALNISNGSTWINNAATDVDAISLTGGSTIVMDGGNIHTASLSDSAPTTLLAAASPTASTIYSTYNAQTGSAFVLTADKATGSFNAGVTSSSSGAAGDMTGNTIVQVTDGSGATFNSMQSDVGVYRYESRSVANADGSTSVILDNITPEPTPDPAPGPNPNPDSRTLSTAAQAVVNTRAAAMSIWSDEQDVLNRRLDNERLTGSSDGTVNAWGSYYGGYHRQQVEQTSSAYDQTNNGFMLGADKRVDIAPGNLLFGFAATRGYSDVNMHDGGSAGTDVDSYGASLYTSLRLNNGLFFDASIKGTHLKNDISVTSLDGGHTTGDYNNNGFGGAFKTGYHKQFNAWYIEPYAQISYARYNSVDYKLKNGLHTKDDGSTSLGLEGGVNVGTAMALNNGTEVRPYVHLAVAGETENSNTMDINGEKINDSTDGSRGIVGLGADVKLSKNLSGWAGANYAKGQDHYESPWQLNAGVSYTW